jgi:hypothetical protein
MATELVATPVGLVVPPGMGVNPWFDWAPILGVPIWLYVAIACMLILIYANIYWILRIRRLASVKGWGESLKRMTQEDVQVWVISKVQKLTIECMTIKDNVLSSKDPNNISMWYVSSPMGVISVGGCRAAVISEDFDRNRDFVTEIALCHNLDSFNENLEMLKEQVDTKYRQLTSGKTESELKDIEKPKVMKQIESFDQYDKYGRSCLYHINPAGLTIPAYNIFNPNKFRKYFPIGNTSMSYGGEIIMKSRSISLNKTEAGFWDKHAFLMIAAGVAGICVIGAWLFPLGG